MASAYCENETTADWGKQIMAALTSMMGLSLIYLISKWLGTSDYYHYVEYLRCCTVGTNCGGRSFYPVTLNHTAVR